MEKGDVSGPFALAVPFLICRHLGDALTRRGRLDGAAKLYRTAMRLKLLADEPKSVARSWQSTNDHGPDFVIIGAAKSGTTSLFAYMNAHPRILSPIRKEIRFFNNVERGLAWYLSHFPPLPEGDGRGLTGEASTSYLGDYSAPERLYELFPRTKLIAILRDPVERAISHYHDDCRRSDETRSLEEAMNDELSFLGGLSDPRTGSGDYWRARQRGYLWMGLYVYFLQRWHQVFPKGQLLILHSQDFYADPAATMRRVFAFVGVSDHPLAHYEIHLKGSYPSADQAIRERLAAFFHLHNRKLEDYLGRKLDWS